MVNAKQAKEIARTVDAYSRDRYSDAGWNGIAVRLAKEGFTAEAIAWVLASKHMRWAADATNRSHSATTADFFEKYVGIHLAGGLTRLRTAANLAVAGDLAPATETRVTQTGADLAGNCEGEDIAELIDLARLAEAGRRDLATRAASILARIRSRR